MADIIETTIKINADTSDINKQMQEVGDLFKSIQNKINECNESMASVSKDSLSSIADDINKMQTKVLGLADSISDSQFESAYNCIEKLKTEFSNLNNIINVTNAEKDKMNIGANGGVMKELLKNSTINNLNQDQIENIRKENEEREKLYETINNQYEAYVKLKEQQEKYIEEYNNIFVDNTDDIDITDDSNDKVKEYVINIEQLKDAFKNIISEGKISKSTLTELANAFGLGAKEVGLLTVAFTVLVGELKLFKKYYDDTIEALEKFGTATMDGIGNSTEFVIDTLKELSSVIKDATETMQDFAEQGKEIQDAFFSLYSYLGEEAGDNVVKFANELEAMFGLDATGVVSDMNKIAISVSKLGASKNNIADIASDMYMFAQNLRVVSNTDLNKIITDLSTVINTGNVGRTSSLYTLFSKQQIEELKSLNTEAERWNYIREKGIDIEGAYENYLKTEAGKLEQLNQQWQSFIGNIGQLALGLFAKLAPLLTSLLQLANSALNTLMKIFNINVTDSTGDKFKGLISDVSDEYDELAKSAEKASKSVASFDDVIQIRDTNTNENNSNIDLSNYDFSGISDDTEGLNSKIKELADNLNNLLLNKDYYGAGQLIASELKKALIDIPWDDIQNNLYNTSVSFGEFINGIANDASLGFTIGNTFAEIINTAIASLEGFGDTLDFTSIGTFLGSAWNGFWERLNADDLANTAMLWFIGLFEGINGWLSTNPFDTTGSTLADLINSFFFGGTNSVTGEDTLGLTPERMDEIVNAVIGFINGVFSGVDTFLTETDIEGIKVKLKELITKLMKSFAENSGDWGETLNKLITTLLDTASELINTADKSGLSEGISSFLDGIDLASIMSKWLHLKFQIWWLETKTKAHAFFGTLAEFIGDGLVKALQLIFSLIIMLISTDIIILKEIFIEFPLWLGVEFPKLVGEKLEQFTENTIIPWWNNIKTWGSNVITDIGKWFKSIGIKISNWFSDIWNTVVGWVDSIKEKISGMFDGMSNIKANISTSWSNSGFNPSNWKLPFMASGGLVSRPTPVIVGDAGREAILPLENNTGWMDDLASKVAIQINSNNNTGSNNEITIDMSAYTKEFYSKNEMYQFGKFMAECLKIYGNKVSIVY